MCGVLSCISGGECTMCVGGCVPQIVGCILCACSCTCRRKKPNPRVWVCVYYIFTIIYGITTYALLCWRGRFFCARLCVHNNWERKTPHTHICRSSNTKSGVPLWIWRARSCGDAYVITARRIAKCLNSCLRQHTRARANYQKVQRSHVRVIFFAVHSPRWKCVFLLFYISLSQHLGSAIYLSFASWVLSILQRWRNLFALVEH